MSIYLLAQARQRWAAKFNAGAVWATYLEYPWVDNGFGTLIQDTTKTPTTKKLRILPFRKREGLKVVLTPSGLDNDEACCFLALYPCVIPKGAQLTFFGRTWPLKAIEPVYQFGGIVGYQGDLAQSTDVS